MGEDGTEEEKKEEEEKKTEEITDEMAAAAEAKAKRLEEKKTDGDKLVDKLQKPAKNIDLESIEEGLVGEST